MAMKDTTKHHGAIDESPLEEYIYGDALMVFIIWKYTKPIPLDLVGLTAGKKTGKQIKIQMDFQI